MIEKEPTTADNLGGKDILREAMERFGMEDSEFAGCVEVLNELAQAEARQKNLTILAEYISKERVVSSNAKSVPGQIDDFQRRTRGKGGARTVSATLKKCAETLKNVQKNLSLYILNGNPLADITQEELESAIKNIKADEFGDIDNEDPKDGRITIREKELKKAQEELAKQLEETTRIFETKNVETVAEIAGHIRKLKIETALKRIKNVKEISESTEDVSSAESVSLIVTRHKATSIFEPFNKIVRALYALEDFEEGEEGYPDINESLQAKEISGALSDDMNLILGFILDAEEKRKAKAVETVGIELTPVDKEANKIAEDKKFHTDQIEQLKKVKVILRDREEVAKLQSIVVGNRLMEEWINGREDREELGEYEENKRKWEKAVQEDLDKITNILSPTTVDEDGQQLSGTDRVKERLEEVRRFKVTRFQFDIRKALAVMLALIGATATGLFAAPGGISQDELTEKVEQAEERARKQAEKEADINIRRAEEETEQKVIRSIIAQINPEVEVDGTEKVTIGQAVQMLSTNESPEELRETFQSILDTVIKCEEKVKKRTIKCNAYKTQDALIEAARIDEANLGTQEGVIEETKKVIKLLSKRATNDWVNTRLNSLKPKEKKRAERALGIE